MAGTTGTPPMRPLPTAQETARWQQDKTDLPILLAQEVYFGLGSAKNQEAIDFYWNFRREVLARMAKYEEMYLAPVSEEPRAQSSRTDSMGSVMSDKHTDYAASPLHQSQPLPSMQTLGTALPDVAPSTGDAHVVQRPLPPQQPFLIRPRKVMSSIDYLKGRYKELRRQYKELCQRFEQLVRENERLRAQLAVASMAAATTTTTATATATAYDSADGVDADGKRYYIIKGVRYDEDDNDFV